MNPSVTISQQHPDLLVEAKKLFNSYGVDFNDFIGHYISWSLTKESNDDVFPMLYPVKD